eukprot:TRINITY_DN11566_c0_g1_i1.p1 TRINITY_DN11566_c0_g1~~TRINITY_DN11566_c0_g1_i1.p1  ORF type:complete len:353 (+),score=43.19 TRINITY_DN11566_c0_g1_i1:27-1085(+)
MTNLQILFVAVLAFAISCTVSAQSAPQAPQPRPNALLAFASFVDECMWTTIIDVTNNRSNANPSERLGAVGMTDIHIDPDRSRAFLSYAIGLNRVFVGYDLATGKAIGGFPLDFGEMDIVSVDHKEHQMHKSQLVAFGSTTYGNRKLPTIMSLLSFLEDKVALKMIKTFNSTLFDSFDSNLWVTSYPEINRILFRGHFPNDPNDFKIFDFAGNLITEVPATQLQPGIRFYEDPASKGFVVTYNNRSGLCFARFNLQTLQIIQNTPDGRCYTGLDEETIAYSPENNGFFIMAQTSLFFISLETPPPRVVYPLMVNVPVKWARFGQFGKRLTVLKTYLTGEFSRTLQGVLFCCK